MSDKIMNTRQQTLNQDIPLRPPINERLTEPLTQLCFFRQFISLVSFCYGCITVFVFFCHLIHSTIFNVCFFLLLFLLCPLPLCR